MMVSQYERVTFAMIEEKKRACHPLQATENALNGKSVTNNNQESLPIENYFVYQINKNPFKNKGDKVNYLKMSAKR